jgi:hypothetical protein
MRTEFGRPRGHVINYLSRASAMARRDFLRLAVARVTDTGFDGLVVGGMDAGQRLGCLVLFAGGEQRAVIFFRAAQAGFDAAVVLVFALIAAHAAFG